MLVEAVVASAVVSAAMVVGRVVVINLLAAVFVFFPREQPLLTPQFLKVQSLSTTRRGRDRQRWILRKTEIWNLDMEVMGWSRLKSDT